jgi:nitrous oxidase accessory protein
MKKLLLHVLLYILIFNVPQNSSAKTIWVGSNQIIKTIQEAIQKADARDTVFVSAGIYYEKNILINKSISVFGINYPVLDGKNKTEIVSIKANHVVFSGFKIQHTGSGTLDDPAGIKIYNSKYVTVSNNILDDTFFGIYVQYGVGCIIKNNKLKAYGNQEQEIGNGIHCWKSDSIQIIANHITGHRDGIYFEFVTNSIIWRNISTLNLRYGLHFMFSNNDSYISNQFINNGAGVAVMYTNHVRMFNNRFQENWGDAAYGLLLKEISDSHIEGNTFEKNTIGILMEGTSRIEASKNEFKNNGWAMKIQASCMDINFTKNNFIGNTFDVSTNGSLVLNTFNGNYWDKYEGYDLNKDNSGDVPYRPLSMFSMIIENNPSVILLFRSIMVSLLDKAEKLLPSLTPENLKDEKPVMKPFL